MFKTTFILTGKESSYHLLSDLCQASVKTLYSEYYQPSIKIQKILEKANLQIRKRRKSHKCGER